MKKKPLSQADSGAAVVVVVIVVAVIFHQYSELQQLDLVAPRVLIVFPKRLSQSDKNKSLREAKDLRNVWYKHELI